MPGLNGRQLFERNFAGANRPAPFHFCLWPAARILKNACRPLIDGVEGLYRQAILIKDLVRVTKKVIDRIHLEKLQKSASAPRRHPRPPEEMSMTDLLQSLEMGQKSCRLTCGPNGEQGELFFASGQCRDAQIGESKATMLCIA